MPILLLDIALFELLDSHLYPSVSIHTPDKPQALFNEDQAKTKIKTATMIFAFGDQGGQQHSQWSCCFVDGLVCSWAYERPLDILGSIFTVDGVGASFSCYES
jgi:hypothetical protein